MNAIFNILSLAFWYGFVWKKVSQGIAGVVAVYNFFATRGNILDHAFGLIASILFIVGMNKVCKRITKRF